MKKLIACLCLIFCFSLSTSALTVKQLTLPEEFVTYSENPQRVSEILDISPERLEESIEKQNIELLAVNQQSTKQIQFCITETDFSKMVQNFSNFSDESIRALLPEITGLENISGEIINLNREKYVKIHIKTEDEKYILTQYFTVIDSKMQTLSFYTDCGETTDYIEEVFPKESQSQKDNGIISVILIAGMVILGIVCLALIYAIVKDLFFPDKKQ